MDGSNNNKSNPLRVDEDFLLPVDDRFRNKAGEDSSGNSEDVAYFRSKLFKALGISTSPTHLTPEVIALATNRNAKQFDAGRQDGPRPSDLGEHEPIPEEVVTMHAVTMEEKEKP